MATNYVKIKKGANFENLASSVAVKGDVAYNSATDKLELYNGAVDALVNEAKAATLTNKTMSGASNTFSSIAYSSLVLTGTIVNADISSSAAIAYSKLALTNSIVNADIASAAAIAYSKLALTGSIVNADISSSAAIAYSKLNLAGSVNLASDVTGTLPAANGGTGNASYTKGDILVASATTTLTKLGVGSNGQGLVADSTQTTGVKWAPVLSNPMTTLGDIIYEDATPAPARLAGNATASIKFLGQTGTGSISAVPAWTSFTAPTITKFTTTGAAVATGYIFVGLSSVNATIGATYTNNGNTYTVLVTIVGGATLFVSGTGTLSGGTLTKASGSGDATITYGTAFQSGTYTVPTSPRAPLYLRIRMVGGGGGGAGSGTASVGGINGSAGGNSYFGSNLVICNGGTGGTYAARGGVGGTAILQGSGPIGILLQGASGGGLQGNVALSATNMSGPAGGNSAFGGAGGATPGATSTGSESAGVANTGGGGAGGACGTQVNSDSGSAGGAGGFADLILPGPLASTYQYYVGSGGSGGANGTNGFTGANGGLGLIEITEYYQ